MGHYCVTPTKRKTCQLHSHKNLSEDEENISMNDIII